MRIAGIDTCALAEFPDSLATVIYFQGCDMDCLFCQNPKLIPERKTMKDDTVDNVFLKIMVKRVDWVVFSGGEPLAHHDFHELVELAAWIRDNGVKLDLNTNGNFAGKEKIDNLYRISGLLNSITVDLKFLEGDWIDRLFDVLDRTKSIEKSRFRMVVYEDSFKADTNAMYRLKQLGLKEIKLVPNSGHGRGEKLGHPTNKYMDEVKEYFTEWGIHARC